MFAIGRNRSCSFHPFARRPFISGDVIATAAAGGMPTAGTFGGELIELRLEQLRAI